MTTLGQLPARAAAAYGQASTIDEAPFRAVTDPGAGGDFAGALSRAIGDGVSGALSAGHAADTRAVGAINGQGDLTQVVTAVGHAELALQTTVAIRDRVVQAYQDIMRMPI